MTVSPRELRSRLVERFYPSSPQRIDRNDRHRITESRFISCLIFPYGHTIWAVIVPSFFAILMSCNTLFTCDFLNVTINYRYMGSYTNTYYERSRYVKAGLFKWESDFISGCIDYHAKENDDLFDGAFYASRVFSIISCILGIIAFTAVCISSCVIYSDRIWKVIEIFYILLGTVFSPLSFLLFTSRLCQTREESLSTSCALGSGGLYCLATSFFWIISACCIRMLVRVKPVYRRFVNSSTNAISPKTTPKETTTNNNIEQVVVNQQSLTLAESSDDFALLSKSGKKVKFKFSNTSSQSKKQSLESCTTGPSNVDTEYQPLEDEVLDTTASLDESLNSEPSL